MKYAIEIEGLTKSYGDFKAVNNLNIRVPEGRIYGFLGKNGAGKTTTIRMIMGLIKADSGSIHILGKNAIKDKLWASRNIGSIVETPGFYENLTAKGNLDITTEMFGVSKKRIDEVLEIVSLTDTKTKKVRDFSLGMKQRLGIANALIHSPRILILDEPTNGLDPSGIKDMRNFLRMLSESKGITIMVSSHILSEVQQLADYVGIINRGSLVEEVEVQSIIDMEQSFLQIEVDKLQSALEVLNKMNLKHEIEANVIKVFCKKTMNGIINKNLVQKEISVSSLTSISQNLEERFLSVTEDRSA